MPPPHPGPRPEGLPAGLVWPVRIDPLGRAGPTRAQARSRRWRRCSRGLYLPAEVELTVEQRIVEAAALLPAYGGVTGWAALRWLGGTWFDGAARNSQDQRPVVLALGDRTIRPKPDIRTSEERLAPLQVVVHRGLKVTSALR